MQINSIMLMFALFWIAGTSVSALPVNQANTYYKAIRSFNDVYARNPDSGSGSESDSSKTSTTAVENAKTGGSSGPHSTGGQGSHVTHSSGSSEFPMRTGPSTGKPANVGQPVSSLTKAANAGKAVVKAVTHKNRAFIPRANNDGEGPLLSRNPDSGSGSESDSSKTSTTAVENAKTGGSSGPHSTGGQGSHVTHSSGSSEFPMRTGPTTGKPANAGQPVSSLTKAANAGKAVVKAVTHKSRSLTPTTNDGYTILARNPDSGSGSESDSSKTNTTAVENAKTGGSSGPHSTGGQGSHVTHSSGSSEFPMRTGPSTGKPANAGQPVSSLTKAANAGKAVVKAVTHKSRAYTNDEGYILARNPGKNGKPKGRRDIKDVYRRQLEEVYEIISRGLVRYNGEEIAY